MKKNAAFIRGRRLLEGGVYLRAAHNNIFACRCGVYSRNYGILSLSTGDLITRRPRITELITRDGGSSK